MNLVRLMRDALAPYRRQVAVVVLLTALQTAVGLYLPNLTANIINNGIAKGDVGYIWDTGAVMLALTLAQGTVAVIAVYFASQVSMGVGRDLRGAIFTRVMAFSAREMNHFGTPSLITRNTNDVQQIQIFLQMALTLMVGAPIMMVGGIFMALSEDVRLSLVLVVAVPLMAVVISLMLSRAVPLFQAMQVKIDRINQVLREQITGVRVIRAFVRHDFESQRFSAANSDLTSTGLRVNRLFVLALPALMGIMNLTSVAVLWFGGALIGSGQMPIGNLTAFLAYILQILMSVLMAVMMVILVPRAQASADRVREVVSTEPALASPESPTSPRARRGEVALRHLSFAYPGGEAPVLSELNLELLPGQTTAIVGGTGSGKSTLLGLIARFYDPTSGQVLVDGVDARQQPLEEFWQGIGLVPQRAYLFSGTVGENLRFARDLATDAELWRALEIAQARDFVAAMPGQLDYPIDQGGTNVSGGQRQRLSIARALVRRPRIYLFDDCFSALDAATDARLRAALRQETRESTVVIVAQRVSTILDADQIVVLDAGKVVGVGRHRELLGTCPAYREIVTSQLGEEAAA